MCDGVLLIGSAGRQVRVGVSRGVFGELIEVVVVCLGSFKAGKGVKSRALGHIAWNGVWWDAG